MRASDGVFAAILVGNGLSAACNNKNNNVASRLNQCASTNTANRQAFPNPAKRAADGNATITLIFYSTIYSPKGGALREQCFLEILGFLINPYRSCEPKAWKIRGEAGNATFIATDTQGLHAAD